MYPVDVKLRVLTWNLNGLEDRRLDERAEAAVLRILMHGEPPEILMFQEVVPRIFAAHLSPHLTHAGYAAIPAVPVSDSSYFCAIFVRAPLKPIEAFRIPLRSSRMGRAIVGLTAASEVGTMLISTAHLESGVGEGDVRRRQLRTAFRLLEDHDGPAIFGGDTNARDRDVPVAGVSDLWEKAGGPGGHRWTWSRGRSRHRFDRLYVNMRDAWSVDRFALDGYQGTFEDPSVAISDHLSVRVWLDWAAEP